MSLVVFGSRLDGGHVGMQIPGGQSGLMLRFGRLRPGAEGVHLAFAALAVFGRLLLEQSRASQSPAAGGGGKFGRIMLGLLLKLPDVVHSASDVGRGFGGSRAGQSQRPLQALQLGVQSCSLLR